MPIRYEVTPYGVIVSLDINNNNNKEGVLSVLGIIFLLILFFYIKFVFY
jgi:hypothetical protein